MNMKPGSLEYWRKYFGTAPSDIFNIIHHAIMVAASDCPQQFKLRRDGIAERLFSCCLGGCERLELAVSGNDEEVDDHGDCERVFKKDGVALEAGPSKESNVNICRDNRDDHGEMDVNHLSNYSIGEAEALTDEIEQESQDVGEVLRIKNVLLNHKEESDSVLFESLRRLQLMEFTLDRLKETKIGRAVSPLKKHRSKHICQLAQTLIGCWTKLLEDWCKASTTTAIAASEGTPEGIQDYVNPPLLDEVCKIEPNMQKDKSKFEATKRKLQERYQQIDNAKRQRTIQVVAINDLPKPVAINDLPKPVAGQRDSRLKPGNQNRQRSNAPRPRPKISKP